nr:hypothetical protein [uncultured Acetatifactor sp.]
MIIRKLGFEILEADGGWKVGRDSETRKCSSRGGRRVVIRDCG